MIKLLSERLILTSFSAQLAAGINVSVHLLPTIHNDCKQILDPVNGNTLWWVGGYNWNLMVKIL